MQRGGGVGDRAEDRDGGKEGKKFVVVVMRECWSFQRMGLRRWSMIAWGLWLFTRRLSEAREQVALLRGIRVGICRFLIPQHNP